MTELKRGNVTGRTDKNNDENKKRRFLQVRIAGETDTREVEFLSQAGEDSSPENGATVLLVNVGGRWFAIAADDGIEPEAQPGEKHLYSSNNSQKRASVVLRTDGLAEINGNADFAVRFNALEALMNTLVDNINAELTNIQTAISDLGGTYNRVDIAIDLAMARVESVKLP